MFAIAFHEWLAQAVWVFVQLLQCAAFGANESMAEYIVTIATNTHNLFLRIDGDF
jgi:hypothetical protein